MDPDFFFLSRGVVKCIPFLLRRGAWVGVGGGGDPKWEKMTIFVRNVQLKG